jgi:hypothetical protein
MKTTENKNGKKRYRYQSIKLAQSASYNKLKKNNSDWVA